MPRASIALVALALASCGGGGSDKQGPLELEVVSGNGGAALSEAPGLGSSGGGAGSLVYGLEAPRVPAGEPFVVGYEVVGRTRARIRLDERTATATLESGRGQIRVPTEGLDPGDHELELSLGSTRPTVEPVEVAPQD